MNVRRACAVMAVWQLCACGRIVGIEELREGAPDAAPVSYTVTGTAVGLLAPVTARLEHAGGIELMRIEEDGAFEFAAALAEGDLYSVTLVDEPPCVLADASGQVEGAIPPVSLACESVLLDALALSGATAPELDFAAAQPAYEAEVSLLQQFVQVTATTASEAAALTVNGTPVTSGAPSEPIALALGDNHIEITVTNERGAQRVYVVNVARAAKIAQYVYGKASNTGAGDQFGMSIALWGDTLVVGANGEDSGRDNVDGRPGDDSCQGCGAVYVFRRENSSWMQEAFLKASNPGPGSPSGDSFGFSVAIWGDVLAVGAPNEDSGATGVDGDQNDDSTQDSGAVYVFRREAEFWVQEAYLKASNTEAFDGFGTKVALWDGTLAVSATGEDSGSPGVNGDQSDNSMKGSGAVYIFTREGTSWSQDAYIKASNPGYKDSLILSFGDRFGSSLALWRDTLAVGADSESSAATGVDGDQEDNSADYSGAVYVFQRTVSGWTQEAYIKASNTGAYDQFGASVSLWEDILAVGAPFEDSSAVGIGDDQTNDDAMNSGAVYLFRRSDSSWTQEAYIKASNSDTGDNFGRDVAIYGELLAVGATLEDGGSDGIGGDQSDNGLTSSGAAYLFRPANDSWLQDTYLKASNPDSVHEGDIWADNFGARVALWEDSLVIAALYEDSNALGVNGDQHNDGATNSGAVYIFH